MPRRVVDDDMRRYYDRRAREYDDWWLGTGLFAERERPGWSEEVERLVSAIRGLRPARTLDVACGTGHLTRYLPGQVVALDQSESMVADGEFERVFTSHFYGHLLPGERERFVAEARRVGGQLVVVDAASREDVPPEGRQWRVLNDGSRHSVYKRFFEPEELAAELGEGELLHSGRWFVAVAA